MRITVIELKTEDVFLDIGRVHQSHRPGISAGRVMRLSHNGKSRLLVARGARANRKNCLAIDLKTRLALGIPAFNQEVEIEFRPANQIDEIVWGMGASEPIARIATKLAVLSVILGTLGLVMGIWSVVLTLL